MLRFDIPTRTELEMLGSHRAWPAVSIRVGSQPGEGDRAALRSLVRQALGEVAAACGGRRLHAALAAPLGALAAEDRFRIRPAASLAVYAAPGWARAYRLPVSVPDSRAVVADRFRLRPLLQAVTAPGICLVLVLPAPGSGEPIRLLEVARDVPPRLVRPPGLPRATTDARDAVALVQRARLLDRALRPVLAGQGVPLILAATEPVASVFRSVSTLPRLAAEGIALPAAGGQSAWRQRGWLAAAAREVVERQHRAQIAALHDAFACRVGDGRATADTRSIARAATLGAVRTLAVDLDAELRGMLAEEDGRLLPAGVEGGAPAWCSYRVTEEIAWRALCGGARVLVAPRGELPGGAAEAAAILSRPV